MHLSQRLKCTIVITRCPSSVVNFSHSRLLLWNRSTELNKTWQEARSQRPLPSLCFSGRSEKQDDRPGRWLAETFSTSPLKPLNGIQRNSTGSKISTSSTKFVFFFRADRKKQDGRTGLWWVETFSTSLLKRLNRIQWNLTGSEISTSSTKSVFFGPIGKTRWLPWPIPQKGCTLYSGARYVDLWVSCSFKSCNRKEEDAIKGPEKMLLSWRSNLHLEESENRQEQPPCIISSTCFGEPKSQPSPSSKIQTKCSSMIIMLGDKTSLL